jgi:hypothetical protein
VVTVLSQPQTPIKPPASVPFGVRAGRFWEIWYPWIIGVAAGTGVYIWNQPPDAVYGALNKSLSSALDAAAVLAGFQSTALSLLLTLVNSQPIKKLRRLSLFRPLVWYHAHAIGALLICIVVFVLLLAVMGVHTTLGDWSRLVGAFVSMLVVAAMLAACRVTWLMVRVLVKHGDQMSDAE